MQQPLTDVLIMGTLAFLIGGNLTNAWLTTNVAVHIWNSVFRGNRVFTRADMTSMAFAKFGAFGDLFVCPICSGTWFTLLATALVSLISGLAWWPFAPLFVLAFPWLYAKPTAPVRVEQAASKSSTHPKVAELLRQIAANPTAEPPALWTKLYGELQSPTTTASRAIVENYRKRVADTSPGEERTKLMHETLGRLFNIGIR